MRARDAYRIRYSRRTRYYPINSYTMDMDNEELTPHSITQNNTTKMASLSTKTFSALNSATGLNIITVKASNAIEAINIFMNHECRASVAVFASVLLDEMMEADDHYGQDLDGDMIFGYSDWKQLNYIFCANSGSFLTVLSSDCIQDGMQEVDSSNGKFFETLGAVQA